MWLCASWADEYRPSSFVILINFSNLAVIKKKLSRRDSFGMAKRATGILVHNLRKTLAVGCNFFKTSN